MLLYYDNSLPAINNPRSVLAYINGNHSLITIAIDPLIL